jgi:hypothetical protein
MRKVLYDRANRVKKKAAENASWDLADICFWENSKKAAMAFDDDICLPLVLIIYFMTLLV